MLKNYFTLAIRNIRNRKFFTGINILGMTIGITACLLIALYVIDEFSYDRFHANADRIYQIGLHKKIGMQDLRSASTCPPLADAVLAEIPEVESVLRLTSGGKLVVRYEEKMFIEDKVFVTESNFFDFFSFQLIAGNAKTALQEPNTVVLTEKTARKYFGDENPLEKLITIDQGIGKKAYSVTGVAADCPGNSHFKFNVLLSAGPDSYFKVNAWLNSGVFSYFLLRENKNIDDVEQKLEKLLAKYEAPAVQQFLGNTLDEIRKAGGVYSYYTTKITDIHLKSSSQGDIEPGGSLRYIYIFGGIGVFILVIACINFMNMSTAQSAGRAKEVGLRKTLGSLRSQLIGQFLTESMLYSLVAVVLAVMLCCLLLPAFNLLSGKELSIKNLLDFKFMLGAGLMLVIVGLLAGSYPAFYLTAFSPVEVLKGKVRAGLKSKGIRSTLVVFQFAISIFLIIFTLVVYTQINFMQQQQMGMNRENVLVIENVYRLGEHGQAFRDALAQQAGVSKVSFTVNKLPLVNNSFLMRSAKSEEEHQVTSYYADYDLKEVLKLEMKEGRYFSQDFPSDSTAVVINETAAKEFGFDQPEGEEILHSPNAFVFLRFQLIGIIKDFNFESYRDKVQPLAIFFYGGPSDLLMVRYEGNVKTLIDNTSQLWKQFADSEPFEYTFLDENFDKLYRSEERIGQLLSLFSGLAIFIACLGLFALAAFTAEQRTKEIGIRKILGASVRSISMGLTKEFIVLVFIAFVPAATIGWWVSSQWLDGFAYRVDINQFIFVGAGISAIAIAWLTVGFQSIKAARANPVDSLRHE
ncbi:MAG: ABC transporter permease [Saprospiraceae bacterium]